MEQRPLDGKIALITGAGSDIGLSRNMVACPPLQGRMLPANRSKHPATQYVVVS